MAKRKKKKTKASARRTLRSIGIACLFVGILACFLGVWCLSSYMIDAYSFDITNYKMDSSSIIYGLDSEGNPVMYETLHSDVRRVWVEIDKIPKHVQEAAIAIEDERFYSHKGMDVKRTAGAVFGFLTGTSDYGGSTITQQLVKNVTNDWANSPDRKLREIFRALVLETKMEKDQILEYYLNIVYFGNGSNGVQMAAHTYFDKDVSELSVAEGAAIVGITQSPSALNPFENPDRNKDRQMLVLGKMKELGYLTEEEYTEAANEELKLSQNSREKHLGVNSYFSESLAKEVANDLAIKEKIPYEQAYRMVYSGGIQIYSTVEVDVQRAIENTFEDSENTRLFPKLSGDVQPQAAMVIMTHDGKIAGMVGGVGVKNESLILNRAEDSYRQPGSSIKPLAVYGPAVELNVLSPGSIILDEPFSYNGWNPQNWYRGYKGNVTMREAVVQSMNIPAIKTLVQVGIDNSFDFVKNKLGLAHISEKDDKYLAPLSLGGLTTGVSVKEMTAAYAAFANKGTYTEPYMYTKVVDKKGKILLEKEVSSRKVFSEQTAAIMTSVLKSTAEGSLGISARLNNMNAAGKTGTTNDDKDRWYVGYTPYYVAGVWYGYDEPKTVPYSSTSVVAHKLWKNVMNEVHEDLPNKSFESAKGVQQVTICMDSGNIAAESCTNTRDEIFKSNMLPVRVCTLEHISESEENPEEAAGEEGQTGEEETGETQSPTEETTPEPEHTPAPVE